MMHAILLWAAAHSVLIWMVVTSGASLIYKALDETTRGHAFFSTLAGFGIDIPKIIDGLRRTFVGGGSGGASAGGGSGGAAGASKRPPASLRRISFARWLAVGCVSCLIASYLIACNLVQKLPPNTPTDLENAIGCVTDKIEHAQPVDACIVQYGPVLVADALQALFDSAEFAQEHPELRPTLKAELFKSKAAAAKAEVQ